MGNRELDVVVENEVFGRRMEEMFQDDIGNATEIVLRGTSRVRPAGDVRVRRVRGAGASATRDASLRRRRARERPAASRPERVVASLRHERSSSSRPYLSCAIWATEAAGWAACCSACGIYNPPPPTALDGDPSIATSSR